jgi:hypothetical protein
MSHRDQDGHSLLNSHAQDLSSVVEWLLTGIELRSIGLRTDCRWSACGLVSTALLWAWSEEPALTRRFEAVLKIAMKLWPREVTASCSYQAFLKLLVRWTVPLMSALKTVLRMRMQKSLASRFHQFGFSIFGADGSRLGLPRTTSNEERFSAKKTRKKPRRQKGSKQPQARRPRSATARKSRAKNKKSDSPQLWITTLWHAGIGLPWDWLCGPTSSSERHHVREMISALPQEALLACDANFIGYDFWTALLDSGREFVIRVGSNVRLLRKLGYVRESGNTVYVWPNHAAQKKQAPLVLRLVVVQGARNPWYLLTSVRNPARLSDAQIAEIYTLRWGIELFHRHFKRTFDRHKLRSHKADHVECEAHWSMLGLWAMLLHAAQYLHRQHIPPSRMSIAAVLRAYRTAMRDYKNHPDPGESLWQLLDKALIDNYLRKDKASRGYPRKKYDKPPGPPKISNATSDQIAQAKQLRI